MGYSDRRRHAPSIPTISIMTMLAAATLSAGPVQAAPAPATLLILPIAFTDTSGEVEDQSAVHLRRANAAAMVLARALPAATTAPAILTPTEMAARCPSQDPDCLLGLARARGAGRILVVEAFKTSTLILEMRMNLIDVATNHSLLRRFMSFRGDNDAAWDRAARFLAAQLANAP